MSVTLVKGQELTKNDLNIFITDDNNVPYNPFSIVWTIYRQKQMFGWNGWASNIIIDPQDPSWINEYAIVETINSVPIVFGIGNFFAPWVMPKDIEVGTYRIKWDMRKYEDSPPFQEVEEFDIMAPSWLSADARGLLPHNMYQGSTRP
jgi:hypothetical protein